VELVFYQQAFHEDFITNQFTKPVAKRLPHNNTKRNQLNYLILN